MPLSAFNISISKPMTSGELPDAESYDSAVSRNEGLAQIFRSQVLQRPSSVAVVDGEITLTYEELHSRATVLARALRYGEFMLGEPVGIIAQHGFADVVTQIAILYAGGSCVPMDPTLPDPQIQARLQKLQTRYVLVDKANAQRSLPFQQLVIDDWSTLPDKTLLVSDTDLPVKADLEHRTHIIHTSGTTSEPKAVQIAARSILQVVFHAPFEPVLPTDTVAHVNNSSFDVSLFDIWAPLLRGASIAVLKKDVLLDLPVMAAHIDRFNITVMATTTALLNLAASTYPKAFSKLRICFIGGEAANATAIKTILAEGPPANLINAYGPTECCVFCLAHRVTIDDAQSGNISIGKPIGHGLAYICDESGELVPDGEEGELLIGGAGVSPGYINQPEKNAASFISNKRGRLYRTGDIVRRRVTDGQIDYVGRRDHQVKIRGFRIELEAVEAAMLKTGQFSQAVALKVDAVPGEAAGSVLIAFAVLAPGSKREAVLNALDSLKAVLPDYMVPRIEILPQIPLDNHAKADRKHLTQLYRDRWAEQQTVGLKGSDEKSEDTYQRLARLWSYILGLPVSAKDYDADFFLLGATSLQASLLISQIRRAFDAEVSLLTLYDNSSLAKLSAIIEESQGGTTRAVFYEQDVWLDDSKMADKLGPLPGPVVDWKHETEGRVFLTGATGFVGAFFLADLLHLRDVHQVGCLVRAADPTTGLKRLQRALAKYNLWEDWFVDKLLPICGTLEDQHLGLGSPERFEELANWTSVIFHLGARVNYTQPYSLHRPANVVGTVNILRLACTGRTKALHYVSSISCFGPTGYINGFQHITEDESLLKHLDALPYDHGYAQSQWVVENMLQRLIKLNYPIAVYRPGFITGHTQTGACNPDDFFSRLIHACAEIGCYPLLPNQRKEFVPVDYVNTVILHIASLPADFTLGHAYHIVPPNRAASIDMNHSMELASSSNSDNAGAKGVPYREWIEILMEKSPERLRPLQPMLTEKVHQGLTRWELYENMPLYETSNTNKALESYPGELQFPILDGELMQKYLSYLQS
ncbi:hypothetical protein SI65_08568 [Aspergillus cristatus]|uniref:Carrier domain-containing protein n=1 Tax=Aspergillus cristatus TaxID=573508 RepID=A0A1E3B5E1_ASPCR|nr:hypothetical protein SI65_08568 [Aspergillus cristatus]